MKWFYTIALAVLFAACGNSDGKIEKELNEKLSAANPNVRGTVKDGVVTLTGTCPDESCKNVSETAARETKGVKNVISQIQVSQPAPSEPTVVISPDASLKNSVDSVLKNYNNVKASVSEGVVTLTGEIKRSQLSELMQDVTATNPKKIDNKLQIK
jgi:hyperosmotically inducible protein